MEIFKKCVNFFRRNFWIFLLLIILVSYGQLLWMQPWQDDNALFFKLANIEGPAGFLGKGPLGEGAYKYTATPFIPIYNLFGHNPVPYFALAVVFYFLATLSVYKLFSEILGKKTGRLAGFLFAAGYLASDGFIRLYNTITTSVSIFLISFWTYFYWKFYKERRYKWYFLTLLMFLLATEFARSRTHYFIAVVILFEVLFLTFEKPLKSLFVSVARLVPFGYIFYKYFVVNADKRSGQVTEFFQALLGGEFHQTYSWLSSLTNTIIPDWIMRFLFNLEDFIIKITAIRASYLIFIFLMILLFAFYISFKKRRLGKLLTTIFSLAVLVWTLIYRNIFSTPILNLPESQLIIVFLGGIIILLAISLLVVLKKAKGKLFAFFFFWLFINIGAYAAYQPTVSYETINRLLAHSFFALVGIFALLVPERRKKLFLKEKLAFSLIIFWGLGNLASSVLYQNKILKTRSFPIKSFYTELKSYVPKVEKGDVFYFDIADNAKSYFANAFSVAQMPEETAIAWRYGVDRYEIKRVVEFDNLIEIIDQKGVPFEKVHAFFYSTNDLIDTSEQLRRALKKGSLKKTIMMTSEEVDEEIVLELVQPVRSVTPIELELQISAWSLNFTEVEFPYIQNTRFLTNKIARDNQLRRLAFEYGKTKSNLLKQLKVATSSEWRERVQTNLIDNNLETIWQSDRVLWDEEKSATLTLDSGSVQKLSKFVWINGFESNSPIEYSIKTSLDGNTWENVAKVSSLKRIDPKVLQVVKFNSQRVRFIQMEIFKTLNNDSPAIAEAWVIPSNYSELDIIQAEEFLEDPFGYVPDILSFKEILTQLGYKGNVRVYWQNNKSESWVTDKISKITIGYDGISRNYKVLIPAGGTNIMKIKFSDMEIPGSVILKGISVRHLSLQEIVQ